VVNKEWRLALLAVLCLVGLWPILSTLGPAPAGRAEDRAAAAVVEALRELEGQLNKAVVQGDVATFDRLLADDFTHTSQDGRFRTRAEWMKGRVQGKTNYVSYEVDDLQIRVFGDAAVATGRSKPSWRESDGTVAGGQYRFLRVWAKRDGRWRAVAFQSTRILDQKD
jgi:ketosteroid isomerase-like protein